MKPFLVLLPLVLFAVIGLVAVLVVPAVIRHNAFKTRKNQIELEKLERQAELDLKLQEWQATASLEDLTRQRQRLEADLDDMHDVIPVYDTDGTKIIGYRRKENQK